MFHAVIIVCAFLFTQVGFAVDDENTDAGLLKAGAALSNITPNLDEPIVGGFYEPPARHVHDQLWVRSLVLDDGRTKLAFVICDGLDIPRQVYDAARKIIFQKTAIPETNIMMAATHTHSSVNAEGTFRLTNAPDSVPPAGDGFTDYQRFLITRIADSIRCAFNNLQPAQIGFGVAQEASQVFNRRYFMKPGSAPPNPLGSVDKVVMNPGQGNPNILKAAGPTDPDIAFISIQSKDGRPIALLANYALHYVGPDIYDVISADYFGAFTDRIQQLLKADRLDPPFVGILTNGCSGDINNINWLKKPEKKYAHYEKMREVADCVARAVLEQLAKVQYHDRVQLSAQWQDLTLAVRRPTQQQLKHAEEVLKKPKDAKLNHPWERHYASYLTQMHKWPDDVTIALQTFRLGDQAVCAIPFEVFVEIGLEIKEKSPFSRTFTISHANGTYGYLPAQRHYELGGYETWVGTSSVEQTADSKIIENLLDMLEKMKSP